MWTLEERGCRLTNDFCLTQIWDHPSASIYCTALSLTDGTDGYHRLNNYTDKKYNHGCEWSGVHCTASKHDKRFLSFWWAASGAATPPDLPQNPDTNPQPQ